MRRPQLCVLIVLACGQFTEGLEQAASTVLSVQQHDPYGFLPRIPTADVTGGTPENELAWTLPTASTLQSLPQQMLISDAAGLAEVGPEEQLPLPPLTAAADAQMPATEGSVMSGMPAKGGAALLPSQALQAYPGLAGAQARPAAVIKVAAAAPSEQAAPPIPAAGAALTEPPAAPARAAGPENVPLDATAAGRIGAALPASADATLSLPPAKPSEPASSPEAGMPAARQGAPAAQPTKPSAAHEAATPLLDLASGKKATGRGPEGCRKSKAAPCRFFILDVSDIATELGFPACSEDRFVADPESGVTLPNPAIVPNFTGATPPEGHGSIYPFATLPHYQSQNAGPWYLYQTLRNSVNTVRTIGEADMVYVYDYCYMMWALAEHHVADHWWLKRNYDPERSAGRHLLASYRAIMGLPRWRRSGGRDFVFFHSHPGFELDDLDTTTACQDMVCVDFQWATMLVVEQGQRWRCASYNPRNTLVVPYSSTQTLATLPLRQDSDKDTLLFFRGRCDPAIPGNMGKLMRSHVVRSLRQGLDASAAGAGEGRPPEVNVCCNGREASDDVRCTAADFEPNSFSFEQHRSMLEQMANSAFCLVLPGNSQSSQRLTEAFLTGCIPVFVGPPWHALPLTQQVDYVAAALFLNISVQAADTPQVPWWEHPEVRMKAGLDPRTQDVDRYSPAWWYADVPDTAIIPLRKLEAVLPYLRQMPDQWVEARRQAVLRHRSAFMYATSPQDQGSASEVIISLLCSARL